MRFNCHSHSTLLIVLSLSHVRDTEDESKQHAQGAHHYVADSKEVVLAAESISRR